MAALIALATSVVVLQRLAGAACNGCDWWGARAAVSKYFYWCSVFTIILIAVCARIYWALGLNNTFKLAFLRFFSSENVLNGSKIIFLACAGIKWACSRINTGAKSSQFHTFLDFYPNATPCAMSSATEARYRVQPQCAYPVGCTL